MTLPRLSTLVLLLLLAPAPASGVDVQRGSAGMVVTDTPLASEVGRQVLASGGNAVDASIAVGVALQVTWPEAGNLGGGGFMMVAPPGAPVQCVEYRETAPASVTKTSMTRLTNHADIRFVGVPGTLRGFELAHRTYGTMPWADLLAPSIALAEEGFVVDSALAASLNRCLSDLPAGDVPAYREFRRIYAGPHDGLWRQGDRLVQPDLAATLRRLADSGADAFYRGPIAKQIVAEMERQAGWVTAADLAAYQAQLRAPVAKRIAGHTVYGAPLPSSGGTIVAMQLAMLERLGFRASREPQPSIEQLHWIVEVMRRSFRDRAAYLGDADFVDIEKDLLDDGYLDQLAQSIDRQSATDSHAIAGPIAIAEPPYESEQTTHYSIIDAAGMAVSNTYTLERSFGSRIVVSGAGFLLNNEMGDFNRRPGYTDQRGWIGTPPNQLAPGKRMLSSMSPTIVKREGDVVCLVGSPGGRTIINTLSLILTRHLLQRRPLAEAVATPRLHHSWFPDTVYFEDRKRPLVDRWAGGLRARGHDVQVPSGRGQGSAHAIAIDPATGIATGVADTRRGGAARAVTSTSPQTAPEAAGQDRSPGSDQP